MGTNLDSNRPNTQVVDYRHWSLTILNLTLLTLKGMFITTQFFLVLSWVMFINNQQFWLIFSWEQRLII